MAGRSRKLLIQFFTCHVSKTRIVTTSTGRTCASMTVMSRSRSIAVAVTKVIVLVACSAARSYSHGVRFVARSWNASFEATHGVIAVVTFKSIARQQEKKTKKKKTETQMRCALDVGKRHDMERMQLNQVSTRQHKHT